MKTKNEQALEVQRLARLWNQRLTQLREAPAETVEAAVDTALETERQLGEALSAYEERELTDA